MVPACKPADADEPIPFTVLAAILQCCPALHGDAARFARTAGVTPVEALRLPPEATAALKDAGLATVADLVERLRFEPLA